MFRRLAPIATLIVKYTFDNIAFDFLPVQWLVNIKELKASMTMGQPFPASTRLHLGGGISF